MLEYHHADRLDYAVVGTPNKLEYDQGFFVKNGDGAADVKPIAHLYKTQVYAIAEALGVPEEIRSRPPTTDTYALPQSQEEFYFSLPYDKMDLCLYAQTNGYPPEAVAEAVGLSAEDVERVYKDIDGEAPRHGVPGAAAGRLPIPSRRRRREHAARQPAEALDLDGREACLLDRLAELRRGGDHDVDRPRLVLEGCADPREHRAQHRQIERIEEVEDERLERRARTRSRPSPRVSIRAGVRAECRDVLARDAVQRRRELHTEDPLEGVVRREHQHPPLPGAVVDEDELAMVDVELGHQQPELLDARRLVANRELPIGAVGHEVGRANPGRGVDLPSRRRTRGRPRSAGVPPAATSRTRTARPKVSRRPRSRTERTSTRKGSSRRRVIDSFCPRSLELSRGTR